MADLIDPLSVAALNTPADQASAQVLLTVLRDALFGGSGSADLLLPRVPLSELLPAPAAAWLATAGPELHWGHRVQTLVPDGPGWQVDGQAFDRVVLAATATEAARLTQTLAPAWSGDGRRLGLPTHRHRVAPGPWGALATSHDGLACRARCTCAIRL